MNILQEKFEYTKRVKSEAVNLKTNNTRVKIKKETMECIKHYTEN